jgi:hypothetical protein
LRVAVGVTVRVALRFLAEREVAMGP